MKAGLRKEKCRSIRKLLATVLSLFAVVFLACVPAEPAQAEAAGTEGTLTIEPEEPAYDGDNGGWQIGMVAELYWFAGYVNGTQETTQEGVGQNAVLTADITINDVDMLNDDGTLAVDASGLIPWVPIGKITGYNSAGAAIGEAYGGNFDGQGHVISGLYYKAIDGDYSAGLFGFLRNGTIQRVQLVNSYIESQGPTGGICGHAQSGIIMACYNEATVETGICGNMYSGLIHSCYDAGTVTYGIYKTCGTVYAGTTIEYCIAEAQAIGYQTIGTNVSVTEVTRCDAESLASGAMTYLLNRKVQADELDAEAAAGTVYWYQTIGEGTKPILMDNVNYGKVYVKPLCKNLQNKANLVYSNDKNSLPSDHSYTDGYLCEHCHDINPDKYIELFETANPESSSSWLIDSVEDLYRFADYNNNYQKYSDEADNISDEPVFVNAKLTADLDLNVGMSLTLNADGTLANTEGLTEWTPIGTFDFPYKGTFDGQGHSIKHLYLNEGGAALFDNCTNSAIICNLGLQDSYINYIGTEKDVASFSAKSGTVRNCFSTAVLRGKGLNNSYTVGHEKVYYGRIYGIGAGKAENCYFAGKAYATEGTYVYGAAQNNRSDTVNCYSTDERYYNGEKITTEDYCTVVTAAQIENGALAHALQTVSNEATWSQGNDNYPVPKAGTKLDHIFEQGACLCGTFDWDANLTDDYFADEPAKVDNKYQISNAKELYWFAGLVNGDPRVCTGNVSQSRNASAVLTNDITVNTGAVLNAEGTGLNENRSDLVLWIPIGNEEYLDYSYSGTFDGQGYTISGLVYIDRGQTYAGLFGNAARGTVKNVAVTNSYMEGKTVGGIGGSVETVTACYSDALVEETGSSTYYGGLCGYVKTITYSYYGGTCDRAVGYAEGSSPMYNASTTKLVYGGYYTGIQNLATQPEHVSNRGSSYTISTANPVASGELAYFLNGKNSAEVAATAGTLYWYQNLNDNSSIPGLKASETGKVYAMRGCPDSDALRFSNDSDVEPEHVYTDGYLCDYCYCIDTGANFMLDATTWTIGSAEDLYAFGRYMNQYSNPTAINAVLTADINMNPGMSLVLDETKQLANTSNLKLWTPIGTANELYSGTFDGQGHTISHLYVKSEENYTGLFGYGSNATVKNTGLVDSYIYGTAYVGSFLGRNYSRSTITNCFSNAILSVDRSNVGGIAYNATVNDSYYTGTIYVRSSYSSGSTYAGITQGTATNSYYVGANKGFWYNSSAGTWTAFALSGNGTNVTEEQLTSGEVAYNLNGNQTEIVWRQTIGEDAYPVLDSTHGAVYQVHKRDCPGDGTLENAYSNTNEEIIGEHAWENGICSKCQTECVHADDNSDGKCDACDEFMNGIGARLAGYTVSLEGNIGVNFYMELSAAVAASNEAYMQFTLPNDDEKVILVAQAIKDTTLTPGKTYYVFKCGIPAKDMEETIIAQMVPGGDTESINYEFSVKSYADYILGNNFPEATKALVQAMLNYGNYAKAYFSKTDLAATDAMAGITAETLSGYAPTRSGEGESSYYGSSLLLESNVVIRHYFTEEVQGATQAENGYWHIDIANIPAHELDAAKDTTVNGVTIRYSPLSYAYIVLNGGSDDVRLQNLVKAMYLYNRAADSYRSGQ